ncbi:Uma2 family endonuclease [candidate division KSB1 bacterium]|nr:Uma2 family endonuclease [candidate division KSB1 bacterium]
MPALKSVSDPLTYEDYKTFPDNDGIRKEIIEGELFMTPAPNTKHQSVSRELSFLLVSFIKSTNIGKIFVAPYDVKFSHINVFQPDIVFVLQDNYEIITDININGAPDLVIEILSPSTKANDRIFKKQIYEKFGVKEYWIVDPENETVEIWVLKNHKFILDSKAGKSQTFKSQILKGLEINLSEIFNT